MEFGKYFRVISVSCANYLNVCLETPCSGLIGNSIRYFFVAIFGFSVCILTLVLAGLS